jgi:hypothetical protein
MTFYRLPDGRVVNVLENPRKKKRPCGPKCREHRRHVIKHKVKHHAEEAARESVSGAISGLIIVGALLLIGAHANASST